MLDVPEDLRYTEGHVWLKIQEDGTIRIGITDHAQNELGDMVFVELPEVGSNYIGEEECAVVESVKSASDLVCPLSGEVIEVNDELHENPEILNTTPYETGWIFTLMPENEMDLEVLLDADTYRNYLEEEVE